MSWSTEGGGVKKDGETLRAKVGKERETVRKEKEKHTKESEEAVR